MILSLGDSVTKVSKTYNGISIPDSRHGASVHGLHYLIRDIGTCTEIQISKQVVLGRRVWQGAHKKLSFGPQPSALSNHTGIRSQWLEYKACDPV